MAWVTKRGETADGRGRYRVRWRDPSGNMRGETVVGRDAALAFKRDVEDALVGGTYVDPLAGRTRVRDYAARWLDTRAHLAPRTRTGYDADLRNHILPAIGDQPIRSVRPSDIEAIIAGMLASGLAPGTVRHVKALLGTMFRGAVRDALVAVSPVQGIRVPVSPRSPQRILTADEIGLLASTEPLAPRYRALVYLAGYGGLRWGELAGLVVTRLRLLQRRVDVTWQMTEDHGRLVEGTPKWGSARTVVIPVAVADELARHLDAHPPGPDGRVFTAARGGPLRYHRFRDTYWDPATDAAGLGHVTPHDLRHTAAALAVAAGAHPKEIQEMMGHRSITTTLNTYGHLFPALAERLAERLDETIRDAAARAPILRPAATGDVVPIRPGKHETRP